MKRFVSILLAFAMVFSMTVSAFARPRQEMPRWESEEDGRQVYFSDGDLPGEPVGDVITFTPGREDETRQPSGETTEPEEENPLPQDQGTTDDPSGEDEETADIPGTEDETGDKDTPAD